MLLAAPNASNPLQQCKTTHLAFNGGVPEYAIDNRLLDCLRSDSNGQDGVALLKLGLCSDPANDKRLRFEERKGTQTGSPSVPGSQLINARSGEFIGEQFCFITCGSPFATLLSSEVVNSDPAQAGGHVKWQFKFVTTGP